MDGKEPRRAFLRQLAGICAAPSLLSACGRSVPPPAAKAKAVDESPLEELGNTALVRPAVPAREPIVRVLVMKPRGGAPLRASEGAEVLAEGVRATALDDRPAPLIRVGRGNQWLRVQRSGAAGKGVAVVGPIIIMMEADGWSVIDGNGYRAAVPERDAFEISIMEAGRDDLLEVKAGDERAPRHYPGALRLISRVELGASSFDVVNDVPMELYLPGVLAGELYRHWQPETFAAQAVAARSFACTEAAVFATRRHYDVTDTASSQMYVGGQAHSRAREAVNATRGLMLAYANAVVSGYYSSCCGGLAASAVDAIGDNAVNNVPPLHGRGGHDVCTTTPMYQWKAAHAVDGLSQRLAAFAKDRRIKPLMDFARLAAIEIAASNEHGRPTRFALVDVNDRAGELSAENFRRAVNFTAPGVPPPETMLRSSNIRPQIQGESVLFEGYGFGHGVGLCQYGAEELAKSGKRHDAILRWYYPGVELLRAYG